ncbi:MAG: hypothetical protein IMF09_01395, partial [Proteobacteria bacterium]|nr:hypothetical protein [Pseudomonadota bacterium]
WRNDTFNKPPGFGLGELICILASEQQELENKTVFERVEMLAHGLLNVANLNDYEFSSKILSCWLKVGAARLRKMKQCREAIDEMNVEVLKDIDNIIKNDTGHFSRAQLDSLMDARGSDFKTQSRSLKLDLKDYALALAAWPKIWQVCIEMPAAHIPLPYHP